MRRTSPLFFQRKLTMALSVPWALLAGIGLSVVTANIKERGARLLIPALCVLVTAATSIRWLGREFQLITANVSNTTMQPVFFDDEIVKALDYLNEHQETRMVILAMPGIALAQDKGLMQPYVPDLNPVISGMTGAYTYAGHWSETPDYSRRRAEESRFFAGMSPAQQRDFIKKTGATYILTPVPRPPQPGQQPEPLSQISDLRALGQVVLDGKNWRLIKL